MEKRYRCLMAHEQGDRNSDKKGTCNALNHDKDCPAKAVIEPYEAEQKAGQKTIARITRIMIKLMLTRKSCSAIGKPTRTILPAAWRSQ